MSLKEFDNGLVGYWDMETTSWSLLKDLSWNGNDWTCYNSWIVVNCWEIWNWPQIIDNYMYFNGIDKQYVEIQDNDLLEFWNNGTIFIKFKIKWKNLLYNNDVDYAKLLTKLDSWTGCLSSYTYNSHVTYLANDSYTWTLLSTLWDMHNIICENRNIKNNFIDKDNIFDIDYLIVDTINNWNYNFYLDWIKKDYNNTWVFNLKNTDMNWHIWKWKSFYLNWFIDDIKIYNRALTDEEIRQQAKIAGF